mgnify:CR=1 FL=1
MIPNYAYWGLPNYTKFINNQTPIVPPQPNIAQAYANSPKFSVIKGLIICGVPVVGIIKGKEINESLV